MNATTRRVRLVAGALAASLVLAACGADGDTTSAEAPEPTEEAEKTEPEAEPVPEPDEEVTEEDDDHDMDAMNVDLSAEELRATLNRLLQEHVYLAGTATGHALAGNDEAFQAAAVALTEGNTGDLADLVGSVYGDDVRAQFFGFWNSHIDLFVDYTVATAEGDEEGQNVAVDALLIYSQELADTFETLTDGELPATASQPGIEMHVTTLKAAVDAQAADEVARRAVQPPRSRAPHGRTRRAARQRDRHAARPRG